MLRRSSLIALVDILAFVSFIFVVSTGVLMRYVLPPKSGKYAEILNLSRHEWGDIHFYVTFTFLAILSIHLVLHWKFIRNVFRRKTNKANKSRLIFGLVGLLAVLALAVAPFVAPIEDSKNTSGFQYGKHK